MIIHVDMDAFYASIEQRDRPELRGLPVIVGGTSGGRGVVSTCSYEARLFGVRSAMPVSEAYRKCPHGIFVPVRMGLYAAVSRDVMEVLDTFSPRVEPLSVDEAFLDVAGCESLYGPPEVMGSKIKDAVMRRTGLCCSVGIAVNKFLAKLATELGKPNGMTIITPDQIAQTLEPLLVSRVFGVGQKTAAILASLGIETMGQLARTRPGMLETTIGPSAARHLISLARGEDSREVECNRQPRQLGSERTFPRDIEGPDVLRRQLLDLAGEVGRGLRRKGFQAQAVRLKIRTDDFATHTRSRKLRAPTDSDQVIYRTVLDLLALESIGRPVRLLGVTGADLLIEAGRQGTLFQKEGGERRSRLEQATDKVRDRFGDAALRPAALIDDRDTSLDEARLEREKTHESKFQNSPD